MSNLRKKQLEIVVVRSKSKTKNMKRKEKFDTRKISWCGLANLLLSLKKTIKSSNTAFSLRIYVFCTMLRKYNDRSNMTDIIMMTLF